MDADSLVLVGSKNRTAFTMRRPAPCIVFNAIRDDPTWGDERCFALIKDVTGLDNTGEVACAPKYELVCDVVAGHVYMVKVLIHNTASGHLNLIAKDVSVCLSCPTGIVSGSAMIQVQIRASNIGETVTGGRGKCGVVWSEVYLKCENSQSFGVSYVSGSGRYYNNVKDFSTEGFILGDSIISESGLKVGYEKMDGIIPGCFQYGGFLTFLLSVKSSLAESW